MDTTMIYTAMIRKVSTPEKTTQKNLPKSVLSALKKMQNEPNLNNSKFSLSAPSKMSYLPPDTWYRGKNEPKTKPIQSRFQPSDSYFKNSAGADIIPSKPNSTFTRRKKWTEKSSPHFGAYL